MQHVDHGDDNSQARLSRPSQPSQTEQHTFLILLDDPDRQCQADERQNYDDPNDVCGAHRDARLGLPGKPSLAGKAIELIMTPTSQPVQKESRWRPLIGPSPRYPLHWGRALKPSPHPTTGPPLGNLTPPKGAMSGCRPSVTCFGSSRGTKQAVQGRRL